MKGNFAVVILAAGAAKRFGSNKLMASYKGEPLFFHILKKMKGIEGVLKVVVTGTEYIKQEAEKEGFLVVENQLPEDGITRSLKLGLKKCMEESSRVSMDLTGVIFCVCDQPELKGETLLGMIEEVERADIHEAKERILRAGFKDRKGNPVYFGRRYFEELLNLHGDQGGKQVLKKYPDKVSIYQVSDRELFDVDRIEDLENLL